MDILHTHFETLPSTNEWAAQHFATFDPSKLTVITAHQQTAGKGQFSRSWLSPKGVNLYASFCFVLNVEEVDPLALTQKTAHCIKSVLESYGLNPTVKWPNDLLVNEKKIVGILTQTTPVPRGTGVIIGVGLNVNMTQEQTLQIDQPATSIFLETGQKFPIASLLKALLELFPDVIANLKI